MLDRRPKAAVVILAGGEATRLPGKLFLDAGSVPMLVRVYRNVSPGRDVAISCKGSLPPDVDALLEAPMVVDRWPLRGPLSGLLSTMSELRAPWIFACAGDAPFVDDAFIVQLERAARAGDEAVVPRREVNGRAQIEPLAALYSREAFIREGMPVLLSGNGALRLVIERLKTRYLDAADDRPFTNVNTPGDYAAVQGALQ